MNSIDRSKIVILGSTGSVGRQALDVARQSNIEVEGISGYNNVALLEEQIRVFRPRFCAVKNENVAAELKIKTADVGTEIFFGEEAIKELVNKSKSEIVVNAITGKAGLIPTVEILKTKKRLALANKESLVIAGALVTELAKKNGVEIIPVDSEHSAIFQCIGSERKAVKKILLTASGGRYYGMTRAEMEKITPEDALRHPTWSMGPRITIDSGTLMNKGFEVIEAAWLFGVSLDDIEVVVQRESIIHSMVEYIDNAVIAQLAVPDMRLCIQYAVTYPERAEAVIDPIDFSALTSLNFGVPDTKNFPCLELAKKAFKRGGVSTAALNAADETAVSAFLDGKIRFTQISDIVEAAIEHSPMIDNPSLDDYLAADSEARAYSYELIKRLM